VCIFFRTKIGLVIPDRMVFRLGPEYGSVEPSECFFGLIIIRLR
jgi:hypothetical protein